MTRSLFYRKNRRSLFLRFWPGAGFISGNLGGCPEEECKTLVIKSDKAKKITAPAAAGLIFLLKALLGGGGERIKTPYFLANKSQLLILLA